MSSGLLDTSVFIAREQRRPMKPLPDVIAVSVMTIAELRLGVLMAEDSDIRARRAETLAIARATDPLLVSEAAGSTFAQIAGDCRGAGVRVDVIDVLIAATAIEHGLPVVTQDDDFDVIARVHPALEVRRV